MVRQLLMYSYADKNLKIHLIHLISRKFAVYIEDHEHACCRGHMVLTVIEK